MDQLKIPVKRKEPTKGMVKSNVDRTAKTFPVGRTTREADVYTSSEGITVHQCRLKTLPPSLLWALSEGISESSGSKKFAFFRILQRNFEEVRQDSEMSPQAQLMYSAVWKCSGEPCKNVLLQLCHLCSVFNIYHMRSLSRDGSSYGSSLSTRWENDYCVFVNDSTFKLFLQNAGAGSWAPSHFSSREPCLFSKFSAGDVAPPSSCIYAVCWARNSSQEKELKSKRSCA